MNRRRWLRQGMFGTATALVGGVIGAQVHARPAPRAPSPPPAAPPAPEEPGLAEFRARSHAIGDRHQAQTAEVVRALRARYQRPVFGRVRVWDLLEKLARCIDPTDMDLKNTSQYLHVCQILTAMERDGVSDPSLVLAALVHDLGKVALLAGEAPEHVVCFIAPVEAREPGGGLGRVLFQFGHDEIAYMRLAGHVPDEVAWLVRYHSMDLAAAKPYMDARDLAWEARYYQTFHRYDLGSKSPAFLPEDATLDRFRHTVERAFPRPILF